jgi:two-component system NtrC family sensor kinase
MGNANQLQQVFTNIILNAQQATAKDGNLWIRAKNLTGAKAEPIGKIQLEFQDTGCGIAPENIERILEPFFTTKFGQKALGLGLTITYRIIQDHGGEIKIESQLNKGTTFIVILPVCHSQ